MPQNVYDSPPYRPLPPGAPGVSDYTVPPNYVRQHPSHSQSEDYYYSIDQRRPPPPPPPYSSYSDRRGRIYSEQSSRPYPSERSVYPIPYATPDDSPRTRYDSEPRPPTSQHSVHPQSYYAVPPPSMRRSSEQPNQRGGPYYHQDSSGSNHGMTRPFESLHQSQNTVTNMQIPSERRESRHSINALLSEEGRRQSPTSTSRQESETSSSMGRSASIGHVDHQERDSMEDVTRSVRLPPLRHASGGDFNHEGEQTQRRSNSNLWKLVSAATEQ
jgi:hypothetical protein